MYYTIKGLVLNSKIQGEYDKFITLYSYEWGKIQAIVPSAKKITAKLSYATEPLTESEFMIYNTYHLMKPRIIGANIIRNNTEIKLNFKRNLYALYAAEISNKFMPFNMENKEKYYLIARIWELLSICKYPKRALISFVLRFLKLSGYSFFDYLKSDGIFINKNIKNTIRKLSNCSGNDLDLFEDIEENKILNYIEVYITNYISRPSLCIFLKKITKSQIYIDL